MRDGVIGDRSQLKVAQIFNLLYRRISSCRPGACFEIAEILNAPDCPIQSDQIAGTGRTPCRLKTCDTVPQTRADAGRYAFGLSSNAGLYAFEQAQSFGALTT